MTLRQWSQTASGNASPSGINFAEGQAPSTVNNSARQLMADVRQVYTPAHWGWVDYSATASVLSQTTFRMVGNFTADFTAGSRLRLRGGSATRYGNVASSSYTNPNTVVTVNVDSGSLSISMSVVSFSAVNVNNLDPSAGGKSLRFADIRRNYVSDTVAFKAAMVSLMTGTYSFLDGCGMAVSLAYLGPMATVLGISTKAVFKCVHNFQFVADDTDGSWTTALKRADDRLGGHTVISTTATLTAHSVSITVASGAGIEVGMLVQGTGIPRETYVSAVSGVTITLTQRVYNGGTGAGVTVKFKKLPMLFDFSGFSTLSRFILKDNYFDMASLGGVIQYGEAGIGNGFEQNYIRFPALRCIVDWKLGLSGSHIDGNHFLGPENGVVSASRVAIAMTVTDNDVKIRNNRAFDFLNAVICHGGGLLATGNHFWGGSDGSDTARSAAIVLTACPTKAAITGNYIDNSSIDMSQETSGTNRTAMGCLALTGNTFTTGVTSQKWLRVDPYFSHSSTTSYGGYVSNLVVVGNNFRGVGVNVTRPDECLTTHGSIKPHLHEDIHWGPNAYDGVTNKVANPARHKRIVSAGAATTNWIFDYDDLFPLNGLALEVLGVGFHAMTDASASAVFPGYSTNAYTELQPGQTQRVQVRFGVAVAGRVNCTASCTPVEETS